ncbi:hypothetical protein L284_13725 [Novosphingobium lindaniclasticum LE124]|uniref:Uncharacterized protein n=1 Tax=Novosphingobium lindaniclasticum LE124 TaxID=1096930 RepID=T0IPY8_9SPHN|nr:hypothetical protein L284_13725 [Novosphingobium lindaniclasticum LE124]
MFGDRQRPLMIVTGITMIERICWRPYPHTLGDRLAY